MRPAPRASSTKSTRRSSGSTGFRSGSVSATTVARSHSSGWTSYLGPGLPTMGAFRLNGGRAPTKANNRGDPDLSAGSLLQRMPDLPVVTERIHETPDSPAMPFGDGKHL